VVGKGQGCHLPWLAVVDMLMPKPTAGLWHEWIVFVSLFFQVTDRAESHDFKPPIVNLASENGQKAPAEHNTYDKAPIFQ
jgi:hypothetical protein